MTAKGQEKGAENNTTPVDVRLRPAREIVAHMSAQDTKGGILARTGMPGEDNHMWA